MKQSVVKFLKNLFKKSKCCKQPINNVGIHKFWGGSESIIYECSKCKKQWI